MKGPSQTERPTIGAWRAAMAGSYWTPSLDFARHYAAWFNSQPRLAHKSRLVIYKTEADVTSCLDLGRGRNTDTIINAVADMLAAEHQWACFISTERSDPALSAEMNRLLHTCRQYVYLGEETIGASGVTEVSGIGQEGQTAEDISL